jgi:hypothetical protein
MARITPNECREEYLKFKQELKELLDKWNVTLYTEDYLGAEITEIYAFKDKVFDGLVLQ